MFSTQYFIQPNYSFTDVWSNEDDFLKGNDEKGTLGWKSCPCYEEGLVEDKHIKFIFFLLYANYGNSHIASSDVNRFEAMVMAKVYQYAPLWVKKTDIQKKLRNLTEEEIRTGSKAIYNSAQNPSTVPSTDSQEELTYIDSQNISKNKRGVLESYGLLLDLLKTDVTQEFIDKFKSLFQIIPSNEIPILYEEGEEEC